MNFLLSKKGLLVALLILLVAAAAYFAFPKPKIDYSTQVKPIFNKKCIACHGGVKQKAGFSLLFREQALGNTESGRPAIIPGKPDESELIRRITETDPEERMPYRHEPLSKSEIKILKQWIEEGAQWGEHWAYVTVKQEIVPEYKNDRIKNDIDRFIYQKLKNEDLDLSDEADKATLLRRVSLDLIGLPPENNIANKYLNVNTDNAYEQLVDSLLASPDYAEKWTSLWLDLARFADTRGYEADRRRSIWKYRDWVINAFNKDMPYDKFLTEQIAGDLLPDPDDATFIATAFHRNTMTNDEGGTENEEYRTAAVIDRVNTTWSVLMGTTFNCVQCHSHPYDPFKHDEYYKFLAFFNNTRDEDTQAEYPLLRQYKSEDSIKLMQLTGWIRQNVSEQKSKEYYRFLKTWQPTINSLLCDQFVNAALISSWYAGLRNKGTCRLKDVVLDNKNQIMYRYKSNYNGGKWFIYLDSLNGKLLKEVPLTNTKDEWKVAVIDISPALGKHDLYFKYFSPQIKTADERGVLFEWFQFGEKFPGKGKPGYDMASKHFIDLMHAVVETTPIMEENNQEQFRKSNVFERGSWLQKAEEVSPGVPHILNAMPVDAPKNRLGLAMWMTDKKNPLVARTLVNRLWEQLFGYGLVESLEDFGTQGISPTHKQLLDHLSWKFMNEHNWSIKKLLKEIVMSATYRQDSKTTEKLQQKDPYNKFYARGPRIRLTSEQLRDQALAVSNLLSKKRYGKSVMPFQPDGIWRSPYNDDSWIMSKDGDQHRRAVYTYLKRTAPYPAMISFDGAAREVCVTRRIRTNTPLQALNTLNDSSFLMMARSFARCMQDKGGNDSKNQIKKGYELMFYKPITGTRLHALVELYEASVDKFKKNEDATCLMMGTPGKNTNPQNAALVVVANALFNLDEWVNKN